MKTNRRNPADMGHSISSGQLAISALRLGCLLAVAVLMTAACSVGASDVVWIGGTGNWNAAANWSPAQVPTSADNTFITNSGDYVVTVPAGSAATAGSVVIGGPIGTQTVLVDRATVTLNGASTVDSHGRLDLTAAQSVLTGPGNVTVNGTLNWANGTISGAGTLNIGNGGLLAIGSGGVTLARVLNNGGTTTWAGGNLTASTGATINNLAGALFDVTAGGRLNGSATTTINNAGSFRQIGGTASTIVTAPFNNSAKLEVRTATLSLDLGGTQSGSISNVAGASLEFSGGAHVLAAGSLVTGSGSVVVSGNATTVAASGIFDAGSTLNVTAGTVTLSSSCNVTGATVRISGTVNFNSSSSVAILNLAAGTLGGTSPVNVTGLLTLSGGTINSGLVNANGGLVINGAATLNGGKLVNSGTAIWSAGNFSGANGAVFSNLLGATFINTFDGNIATGGGATPLFVNAGLFQKTNGTAALGTTSIDFQFINTGTVEVRTNTLRYGINQQTAGLTLLDGGGLAAQAQPLQFLGGSLIGAGLVTVANVQNLINTASISPGLPLGELDVVGNYQQTSAGTLNIELGGYSAGTNFDVVKVTGGGAGGAATLGGTLNVTLTNGFSPTNGATFTFLTADSRAGAFSTVNYPSNDIGMQVSYDLTSAKVRVTNLKPLVANPITDPASATYGAAFNFQFPANTFTDPDNDLLSYTASGMPNGITFAPVTRTFSGVPAEAGIFRVQVMATDGGSPSLRATNSFTLVINPAVLTIAAESKRKTYGAGDPALTFVVNGLQLGDTPATVLAGTLTRATGETVSGSPYAITQGTLTANSNYTFSFTGNSLAITPANLAVTADAKSKTYGAPDPTFTGSFVGFVNGETPAVLGGTLAFDRTPGENAGVYPITPKGLASGNYTIVFNAGTLGITKASLSVNADSKTKTYGAPDPVFTANYAGFVNGESSTVLGGSLAFARGPGENVGGYPITPSGLTSGNYVINFNPGTLTINQADLTVTADAKSKTYGAADPEFTASYVGFVNSETPAVLGGSLAFTREPGESVGSYLITPNGLTSGNYVITLNTGTLSITKAPLSVAADAKTKSYGAIDPALTFTVSGLQFNDTLASVLAGALARVSGESVASGPYAITLGSLTASSNYTMAFTSNVLTITKAALSVRAEAKAKTYGTDDPALTVSYAGFANGETPGVLGGTLAITRAPGENVGSYLIAPTGLTSSNYNISFIPGALSIIPAPLSVTADGRTKTYGTIDPPFTVSYAGFVNSETPVVLGGALSFARTTGESVGRYLVTPGGLTSSNYSITFHVGTLTIVAPAPAMLPLTRIGTTNIVITWAAVSNAIYRVQYKSDLNAIHWNDLPGT